MEIPVYEAEESPCRAYVIQRRTKETRISVDLCLEGGEIRISTGIGFLTTCSQPSLFTADWG